MYVDLKLVRPQELTFGASPILQFQAAYLAQLSDVGRGDLPPIPLREAGVRGAVDDRSATGAQRLVARPLQPQPGLEQIALERLDLVAPAVLTEPVQLPPDAIRKLSIGVMKPNSLFSRALQSTGR